MNILEMAVKVGMIDRSHATVVKLNVGGVLFTTSRETLRAAGDESFFALLLKNSNTETTRFAVPVEDGALFIDRDPRLFQVVLHFLRTRNFVPELLGFPVPEAVLREEFEFFGVSIPKLVNVSDESLRMRQRELSGAKRLAAIDAVFRSAELMDEICRLLLELIERQETPSIVFVHEGADVMLTRLADVSLLAAGDHFRCIGKVREIAALQAQIPALFVPLLQIAGAAAIQNGLRDRYDVTVDIQSGPTVFLEYFHLKDSFTPECVDVQTRRVGAGHPQSFYESIPQYAILSSGVEITWKG